MVRPLVLGPEGLNALPGIGGFLTTKVAGYLDNLDSGLNALPGIGGFLTT